MSTNFSKDCRKAGFHFALGVFECLAVLLCVGWLIGSLLTPTDDCDKSRWDRCGMRVAVDQKTGKEYLIAPGGGIIERGKP